MAVVTRRYALDTQLWHADAMLRGWLSEGWPEDLPTLGGFGLAPMKAEGAPVEYPEEYLRTMREEE